MMKLKVLRQFHDKENDQLRKAGEIFEVSDKRGAEILASKLNVAEVFAVGEPDEPPADKGKTPENAENPPAPAEGTEETQPTETQLNENPAPAEEGGEPAKKAEKPKGKGKINRW